MDEELQTLEAPKQPKTVKSLPANLRERLITAGVGLVLLVIWLIFFDTIALNIVLALLAVWLEYELISVTDCMKNLFALIVSFVYTLAVPMLVYPSTGTDLSKWYGIATFAYILVMFVIYLVRHESMHFEDLSFQVLVSCAVPASLACAVRIREAFPGHGVFLFLLALGGAWLTDTSAYFFGVFFGKHKFTEISPKKTLEGFFGGILGCIVVSVIMVAVYSLICKIKGTPITVQYLYTVIYGLLASLISVVGDLSASLIKRQCQVKDYGKILPGMGGVMDRFDSVLFVLPFTYCYLTVLPVLTDLTVPVV